MGVDENADRPSQAIGHGRPVEGAEKPAEVDRLRDEVHHLHRALESHPAIDQARGMVMALGPLNPSQAWDVLVETSQRTNIKLRDIAEHLVATTDGESLPPLIQEALSSALRRHRTGHV